MSTPANVLNINEGGYVVFDGTSSFSGRTFQEGTNISLTNADGISGNTTISASGLGSFIWENIGANQTLEVFHGYFCNSGSTLILGLPTTSEVGDVIEVVLIGANGWRITQGAGQFIRLGNTGTTVGPTGYVESTQQGDAIRLVCQEANLTWVQAGPVGSWDII